MKLVHDGSLGAHNVHASCIMCNNKYKLSDLLADIEGTAFQDYYCLRCLENLKSQEEE